LPVFTIHFTICPKADNYTHSGFSCKTHISYTKTSNTEKILIPLLLSWDQYMTYTTTAYVAKPVDKNGNVDFNLEENAIWQELYERQFNIIQGRACDEYLLGLKILNLPTARVPQCHEVTKALKVTTGWELEPVPALIPFDRFFYLLANRRFPAATFIRTREELNYLEEPDIFHEIFGHCPLLTNPDYADFVNTYGKLGLAANNEDRILLARLFWFTVEFGLIQNPKGIRAYGGGILSSINETVYCLEDPNVERKPFNLMDALRTPYRIDVMQPIYFVLQDFKTLFELTKTDLIELIHQARALGDYAPAFPPKNEKPGSQNS
jgi:phenylalanine-4-hydroxylase